MTIARYSMRHGRAGTIPMVLLLAMSALFVWRFHDQSDVFHFYFIVALFAFTVFVVGSQLVMTREVIVHADDEIEFVGWARRVRVQARAIRSARWLLGYQAIRSSCLVVSHEAGRAYLPSEIQNLQAFLSDLRKANPSVRLPR